MSSGFSLANARFPCHCLISPFGPTSYIAVAIVQNFGGENLDEWCPHKILTKKTRLARFHRQTTKRPRERLVGGITSHSSNLSDCSTLTLLHYIYTVLSVQKILDVQLALIVTCQ